MKPDLFSRLQAWEGSVFSIWSAPTEAQPSRKELRKETVLVFSQDLALRCVGELHLGISWTPRTCGIDGDI